MCCSSDLLAWAACRVAALDPLGTNLHGASPLVEPREMPFCFAALMLPPRALQTWHTREGIGFD